MPSKRAPKRAGAIPSTRGQRADGKGLDPQIPGYVVTSPRVTPEGWVELDGSLFVRAALEYGKGKPL
jgi:hypothetical protein